MNFQQYQDVHAQQRAALRLSALSLGPEEPRRRSITPNPPLEALSQRQIAQRSRREREAAARAATISGAQEPFQGIVHSNLGALDVTGSQPRNQNTVDGEGIPRPQRYQQQAQLQRRQRERDAQEQHAHHRERAAGVVSRDEAGGDSGSDSDGIDHNIYGEFDIEGGAHWEKQLESRVKKMQKSPFYLAARQPYTEPQSRHYLGRMDVACPSCNALHWMDERLSGSSTRSPEFSTCCQRGQVRLDPMPPPPEPLLTYLTSEDATSRKFRDNIWQYNRAFAFTSMGVREDYTVNGPGRGAPVFRISGELHHYSGALEASEGRLPRYAQLYVIEPKEASAARQAQNSALSRKVLDSLQQMLLDSHDYSAVYQQAWDILQAHDDDGDMSVTLQLSANLDARRYNLPTEGEIAVIIPDVGDTHPRDIVLRRRDQRGLDRISELHPAYVPLQYPLLAPLGTHQWHPDICLIETEEQQAQRSKRAAKRQAQIRERDGLDEEDAEVGVETSDVTAQDRKLTLSVYVAYRIHQRPAPDFNTFLRGGRLFQRYVVDMYAAIDQARLRYITLNQSKFRAAR